MCTYTHSYTSMISRAPRTSYPEAARRHPFLAHALGKHTRVYETLSPEDDLVILHLTRKPATGLPPRNDAPSAPTMPAYSGDIRERSRTPASGTDTKGPPRLRIFVRSTVTPAERVPSRWAEKAPCAYTREGGGLTRWGGRGRAARRLPSRRPVPSSQWAFALVTDRVDPSNANGGRSRG